MPKNKNLKYYEAVGRRKSATARVRLYIFNKQNKIKVNDTELKKGDIIVNGKDITEIYKHKWEEEKYLKPLRLTDCVDRFGISILVKGGGKEGQLDAIVHGIAKALNEVNRDQYRPVLKAEGLLTRDSRVRERRKVGTGGKARRKKQSPKR
ncbi:MAG: 30S ribosomal protein S9 [Patescibacteria group bacterium]|nr:MAG: 30S ribosomal protein S9 [Patescibacteria group bacterium]